MGALCGSDAMRHPVPGGDHHDEARLAAKKAPAWAVTKPMVAEAPRAPTPNTASTVGKIGVQQTAEARLVNNPVPPRVVPPPAARRAVACRNAYTCRVRTAASPVPRASARPSCCLVRWAPAGEADPFGGAERQQQRVAEGGQRRQGYEQRSVAPAASEGCEHVEGGGAWCAGALFPRGMLP